MRPEEQIILLLSRASPSRAAMRNAGNILKEDSFYPVGFGAMLDIAAANGVLPLLYNNLKESDLIHEDSRTRLRSSFLRTVADNIRRGKEVLKITAFLRARGIESVSLKGPIASEIIFGNAGLYPSSDIDILVRPADLQKTGRALIDAGYRAESGVCEEDTIAGTYHLTFYNHYVIEVHWTLSFRYFDIPPDFWWEKTKVIQYEGAEIRVLSPERYILYTIFRLYNKAFRPLKYFILPAGIINKYYSEIDWGELLAFSVKYKMKRLVLFALRLLHELLGADIPEESARERIYGYGLLKRLVLSGLFKETTRIHARMLVFTILHDTPLDTLRILSGRAFPDKSELRLRYRLPGNSKKIYLYYVLNPLILLLKRYKRERSS